METGHDGLSEAAPSGPDGQPAELDVGMLHLDLAHCEATLDGRALDLTPKEFGFLAYLARATPGSSAPAG
jgi:DNA-binding response OmpR family regulator